MRIVIDWFIIPSGIGSIMSTCADFSDKEQLLEAIKGLEINSKYDTQKLDSDTNEGYLKTFRRRIGILYRCALKLKFGERASKVLDQKLSDIGYRYIFIDGRRGNDIYVVKSRGAWRLHKIILPDLTTDPSNATFAPDHLGDLDYDEIKGHQVPNWEGALAESKEELRWIGLAVEEMIYFDKYPYDANMEASTAPVE